jgi:hypothetical protein
VANNKLANDFSNSSAITAYITNIGTMSTSTARQYSARLNDFKDFVIKYNNQGIDDLLAKIKMGDQDPYNLLNSYAAYLKNCNISALTLKQRIVTIKNFLEYSDIDIIPRRFKLKVKLPKIIILNNINSLTIFPKQIFGYV